LESSLRLCGFAALREVLFTWPLAAPGQASYNLPQSLPSTTGESTMRVLLSTLMAVFLLPHATPAGENNPVKVLIITGDEVGAHKWRETAPLMKKILEGAGLKVDLTETPGKDLTPENLAKYDVLLLNYRNTPQGAKSNPASVWSDENKKAFLDAIKGGKGLYVYHFASSAFTGNSEFDRTYEKVVAGGWRKQGYHGAKHQFMVTVRKDHPITNGIHEFKHSVDELYQNSMMLHGSEVLATAYSDAAKDPKNTGKDEPVVWISHFGKGRVVENVLGHDTTAMQSPGFQTLLIRGVQWAGSGNAPYPVPEALKSTK
jgi:type 1 glutamine amidotransferase